MCCVEIPLQGYDDLPTLTDKPLCLHRGAKCAAFAPACSHRGAKYATFAPASLHRGAKYAAFAPTSLHRGAKYVTFAPTSLHRGAKHATFAPTCSHRGAKHATFAPLQFYNGFPAQNFEASSAALTFCCSPVIIFLSETSSLATSSEPTITTYGICLALAYDICFFILAPASG